MNENQILLLVQALRDNSMPPLPESIEEFIEKKRKYRQCVRQLTELVSTPSVRSTIISAYMDIYNNEPSEHGILIGLLSALQSLEDQSLSKIFQRAFLSDIVGLKLCAMIALCRIGRFDLLPDLIDLASRATEIRDQYYYGLALLYQGRIEGIATWLNVLKTEMEYDEVMETEFVKNKSQYTSTVFYGGVICACLEYLIHGKRDRSRFSNVPVGIEPDSISAYYEYWREYYNRNINNIVLRDIHIVPEHYRSTMMIFT